mgnify:CR=1 FL=1
MLEIYAICGRMPVYLPHLTSHDQGANVNNTIQKLEEANMSLNKKDKISLKAMSKEKLIKQIEFYQKDLERAVARSLRYYTAYHELMKYWDTIDDDDNPKLHHKLKLLGL